MEKSESFIENRIKWRAAQHKLPNKRVFLFESLDEKTRMKYLSLLNPENTGKIVLLFTDSEGNWTALGTKMIIGYNGLQVNSVAFNVIKEWFPKNFHELGLLPLNKQKKYRKNQECELLIFDKDDNEIVFITNKGSDFFALTSLVLMLIRLYT